MSPLRNGVIFVCSHVVRGNAYIERIGCSIMLLSEIQAFLLDMDGTVYLGPEPIPGAAAFIHYLQMQHIPFPVSYQQSFCRCRLLQQQTAQYGY